MVSHITPLVERYKLNTSFDGTTVTHITQESNLEANQRCLEVQTLWKPTNKLGAGAFGVVWRQESNKKRLRAVKIISRDRLNVQEVEALIDLQDHPKLFILFLGWFEDTVHDTVHLAMEYIQHGDLGKYIADYKTKVEAKEITSQILEGLVVMHERAICHRDLKPQNILVASLSPIWVKITDFGISKRWVGSALKTPCGTAMYRSPEQLGFLPPKYRGQGNSYTNNIDMWALGTVVHEMLTLEIPFLETLTYKNQDLTLSIPASPEHIMDMGLLYEYCQGRKQFPCDSLKRVGVSEDGIDFVKSLMVVNPGERLSAAVALTSGWLVQIHSASELVPTEALPTSPPPEAGLKRSDSQSDNLHNDGRQVLENKKAQDGDMDVKKHQDEQMVAVPQEVKRPEQGDYARIGGITALPTSPPPDTGLERSASPSDNLHNEGKRELEVKTAKHRDMDVKEPQDEQMLAVPQEEMRPEQGDYARIGGITALPTSPPPEAGLKRSDSQSDNLHNEGKRELEDKVTQDGDMDVKEPQDEQLVAVPQEVKRPEQGDTTQIGSITSTQLTPGEVFARQVLTRPFVSKGRKFSKVTSDRRQPSPASQNQYTHHQTSALKPGDKGAVGYLYNLPGVKIGDTTFYDRGKTRWPGQPFPRKQSHGTGTLALMAKNKSRTKDSAIKVTEEARPAYLDKSMNDRGDSTKEVNFRRGHQSLTPDSTITPPEIKTHPTEDLLTTQSQVLVSEAPQRLEVIKDRSTNHPHAQLQPAKQSHLSYRALPPNSIEVEIIKPAPTLHPMQSPQPPQSIRERYKYTSILDPGPQYNQMRPQAPLPDYQTRVDVEQVKIAQGNDSATKSSRKTPGLQPYAMTQGIGGYGRMQSVGSSDPHIEPSTGPSRDGDRESFGRKESPLPASVALPMDQAYDPKLGRGKYGEMFSAPPSRTPTDESSGQSCLSPGYDRTSGRSKNGETTTLRPILLFDTDYSPIPQTTMNYRRSSEVPDFNFMGSDTSSKSLVEPQAVDTEDQTRWRQWVGDIKESWRKTGRK